MMKPVILSLALGLSFPALAAAPQAPAAQASGLLLKVDADRESGKIVLTLPRPDRDGVSGRFIYLTQLETGLGSAPAGLDRARASDSRILVFRRVGKKVAAEIENSKFVASTGDADEKQSVRNAFATSILWMGDIADTKADGSFTVDLSGFLNRDDMDVPASVRSAGGGEFKFVPEMSAADPNFVRVFPRNAEFASRLTFRSDSPTGELSNVIPGDQTFSLLLRHSLIRLPEPGYVPRTDPYGFAIGRQQVDFSAPMGGNMVVQLARRFRLEKTDPAAPRSPVRVPIIFYIDKAAPEPIRSALRDGVDWWRQAFDAAGYVDAFATDILPDDADPLDIRYNVVNWVNRGTRGWSYGQPIDDPRTGEIIKGSVLLGSLRARQDMLIFQALVGAGLTGSGDPDDPLDAMLARIRQLGAHEVGHAIGLAHNFASSSQGRYSVMDYPAPRIGLDNGRPTIRDAYGVGLGPWDRFAVEWLYAPTDAAGRAIAQRGRAQGLRFVADDDARPVGSAHPDGAIWDDSADASAELDRMMGVRRIALARFGESALRPGDSLSQLRRAFVPLWLLHRYQVEAAAKYLGGVHFGYGLAGEGDRVAAVPAATQRTALAALLRTLSPQALAVDPEMQLLLSSGKAGTPDRQTEIEVIPTAGGPVFDPFKATEVGAVHSLSAILSPDRLNRLESQHRADPAVPAPAEVVDLVIAASFAATDSEVGRRIATTAALALARTARQRDLSPALALIMSARIDRLAQALERARGRDARADWQRGLAALLSDREALDKAVADPSRLPRVPPGMPIGSPH